MRFLSKTSIICFVLQMFNRLLLLEMVSDFDYIGDMSCVQTHDMSCVPAQDMSCVPT